MLLSLALLLTFAPIGIQTPEAHAAVEPQDSAEAYAILERLIERTNALHSFVAEYRTSVKDGTDGPERLRLVYLAPSMGWLQLEKDGAVVPFCSLSDGVMTMLAEHDGQRSVGRADLREIMACVGQAEDQLRSTLGLPERRSYRPSGVSFMLHAETVAGGPSVDGQLGLSYTPHSRTVLGWLEDLRDEPGLRVDGDRLRVDRPDGLIVEVSTATGFVERITRAGDEDRGIFLESLRENVELGPFETLAPEAVEADQEKSARFSSAMRSETSQRARSRMYGHLAAFLERKPGALDPTVREAARSAFRSVHACVLPGPLEAWIERTRSDAGELAETIKVRSRRQSREELDALADRWEQKLRQYLDKARSSFVACIDVPQAGGDAAFLAEMLEIERQAGAEAFDERVATPLLRYLDELVEEALDG
jgi:hypothetical protein